MLVNIPKLITSYFSEIPNIKILEQRVKFGTTRLRGSSFNTSFSEWHVLAITQKICLDRIGNKIDGPLFLGKEKHH